MREPWLQQRDHATLFQPLSHLIKGMIPIQNGEDQGFDPTSTREPMRGMRRDEAVNHGSNLQTSYDAQDQRQVCYGMNLLYGRGHDVPPVVAAFQQHHSALQPFTLARLSPEQKSHGLT